MKGEIVTTNHPASSLEDAFAMRAYSKLDGGRLLEGFEDLSENTSQFETVISACAVNICIARAGFFERLGSYNRGGARYGPARN